MTYLVTNNTLSFSEKFSTLTDAIDFATTKGFNVAIYALAGNVVWRSEYSY